MKPSVPPPTFLNLLREHIQNSQTHTQGHTFHCYARSEGIAGVIISKDYPKLAAHQILSKVVDEFLADKSAAEIARASRDNELSFPALERYLQTYQNPSEVNSIANIQKELDETKIILHKTIESVSCFFTPFSTFPSSSFKLLRWGLSCSRDVLIVRTGPTTRREAR